MIRPSNIHKYAAADLQSEVLVTEMWQLNFTELHRKREGRIQIM